MFLRTVLTMIETENPEKSYIYDIKVFSENDKFVTLGGCDEFVNMEHVLTRKEVKPFNERVSEDQETALRWYGAYLKILRKRKNLKIIKEQVFLE